MTRARAAHALDGIDYEKKREHMGLRPGGTVTVGTNSIQETVRKSFSTDVSTGLDDHPSLWII